MKTEDNSLLVAVVVEFGVEKFPAIEAFQRGWLRVGEREGEREGGRKSVYKWYSSLNRHSRDAKLAGLKDFRIERTSKVVVDLNSLQM